MHRFARLALALSVSVALLLTASAVWARGGGGGGGHGGGGGGGRSGSSSRSSSSTRSSGVHRSSRPSRPMTPEEKARAKRIALIGGGGAVVAGGGIGAACWLRGGFDVVVFAFALKRKRRQVTFLDERLAATDFGEPASRAALLVALAEGISSDDVDGGYSRRLGLKLSAAGTAMRAEAIEQRHQAAAELKAPHAEGEQGRAEGDYTAEETEDDRCVVTVIATVPRPLLKGFVGGSDGVALEDLARLRAVAPRVDGLWVSWVPALEEPLPSFIAKTILSDMWNEDERAEAAAQEPGAA